MKPLILLCVCALPGFAEPRWLGSFNHQALIQWKGQMLTLGVGEQHQDLHVLEIFEQGVRLMLGDQILQLPKRQPVRSFSTSGTLVAGQINGVDVTWRIDTGASHTVISQDLARRLGLSVGQSTSFMEHAQGRVAVGSAWLEQLSLGPWAMESRRVWVAPGAYPSQPLWGLDGLKDLHLTLHQGQLILAPSTGGGMIPDP